MACDWNQVTLGRTGLRVTPLGIAPAQDLPAREVERAFERGVNYFYWGTARRAKFGEGVRNVARANRDKIVVVVQSYTRVGALMGPSLDHALRALRTEYTDLLLLGWWHEKPPRRIIDAALALRERGKARHIMISCHNRPAFEQMAKDPAFGCIMVRYNAAHPGAEREVFPKLHDPKPGVVIYNATRWATLLDPRHTPAGERTPRPSDCYRWVLTNPNANLVVSGPGNAEQLDENLSALDRGPMSEDEMAWMARVGKNVRDRAQAPAGNPVVRAADRVRGWMLRGA